MARKHLPTVAAVGCGALATAIALWRPDDRSGDTIAPLAESGADESRRLTLLEQAELAETASKFEHSRALSEQGAFDEAIGLAKEALDVHLRIIGENADYAFGLRQLGELYAKKGDDVQAAAAYEEAQRIAANLVNEIAGGLNESQQIVVQHSMQLIQDDYLSSTLRSAGDPTAAYERALYWKGAALARQRAARLAAGNTKIAPIFDDLRKVDREWATVAAATPADDAARRPQLDALAAQKLDLEARLSAESRPLVEASRIGVADVQQALPPNAALVDYRQLWLHIRSEDEPGRLIRRQSIVAFVVRRDLPVQMFDLGAAEGIYSAIEVWRSTFGASEKAKAAGILLRARLWEKLESALGDATLVLVSPDGALGKLPFAALPGAEPDTYLIEDVALAFVPVPLLIPELIRSTSQRVLPRHLLALGGVDYQGRADATATQLASSTIEPPWVRDRSGEITATREVRVIAGGFRPWRLLSGMTAEAEDLVTTYRRRMRLTEDSPLVVHLRGAEATEEAFRRLAPECALIHLATHGYFVSLRGHSPGLDSGVVLAGANAPPEVPVDPALFAAMRDDGYLTADEISFLPLGGVQLVVISACDSGMGQIALGEGPLGIQRAFQVAGARSTIATLWAVDDQATLRIMSEFYRRYLATDPQEHLPVLEAMRAAQIWALNHPDEARGTNPPEGTESSGRLPPRFWAAFTLSGDWR